jgi:hypothetical protein
MNRNLGMNLFVLAGNILVLWLTVQASLVK